MAKKPVVNPAAGRPFAAGKLLALLSRFDDRETRLLTEVRQLHRQVAAQGEQLRILLGKVQAGVPLSKPPSGRAAAAVAALRAQLSEVPAPDRMAPESVRRRWIEEGVVVPTAALVEAWGVTRQALDQARDRSELSGLKVGHRFYYPAAFLQLASSQVATVCRQLGAVDAVNKVIFWTRRHEALEGRTVSECLQTRKGMEQVLRLAAALSDELSGIAFRSNVAVADVHAA